ncbi:hypothetical protein [Pedobacter sp. Leaf194]|uniref:hypothetical protein n=1 Tax=Pedobacter sp. Leaf194 TaxID=1736297 RepID=UPI000702E2EA|nr:hypothetical protein [Pedobacter sp. Leaf194]KQS40954.1 hypothetical protein ASG14_00235 [Pedobacter sp. Leaf194]RYD79035.1 MAG: hypothetical protein EOP55_05730 [Sphingobacteriales bacterium]
MENSNPNDMDAAFAALQKKFEAGVVESVLSESGALTYIVKDGLDLTEYAAMAKQVLETHGEVAHDFKGRVVNESKTDHADFVYKSGWPLDHLSEGEIE